MSWPTCFAILLVGRVDLFVGVGKRR